MPLQTLPSCVHFTAQLLHASQHSVEAAEAGSGVGGNDPRQGCFANPWRSVEDQIADAISGDGASQQTPLGENAALAFKVLEAFRPHAVRKGSETAPELFALIVEKILTQRATELGANFAACQS